jgi:hypothetical protein
VWAVLFDRAERLHQDAVFRQVGLDLRSTEVGEMTRAGVHIGTIRARPAHAGGNVA